jgi:GAF domain-containing protein
VGWRAQTTDVNDTASDATYHPNPLLPETRSEAAVPLRVGDRIVGVMDVQSNEPGAFQEDDVRTLQILADQLAVAVVIRAAGAAPGAALPAHNVAASGPHYDSICCRGW